MTTTRFLLAGLLAAALSACGGGGGSPGTTGAGAPTVGAGTGSTPVTTTKNQLFAYDAGHGALAGLPALTLNAGSANTVNVLDAAAAPTGGLAYDSQRDLLYATTADGIAVYEHASQLAGSIAPARVLRLDPAAASAVTALFYDKRHDILYASGTQAGAPVFVALDAPSGLSGTVKPNRTIAGIPQGPFTIDTTRNLLYVAPAGATARLVYQFKNLDTLNGSVDLATSAALQFGGGGNVLAVAIDAVHDRLYYVAAGEGVRFTDAASTGESAVNGSGAQFLQTTLLQVALAATANAPAALAYDAGADRLYAASGNLAYEFDNASKIAAGGGGANAVAAQLPAGTVVGAIALP